MLRLNLLKANSIATDALGPSFGFASASENSLGLMDGRGGSRHSRAPKKPRSVTASKNLGSSSLVVLQVWSLDQQNQPDPGTG